MQCVFCEATSDLNTKFTIAIDDSKKVEVLICDTHAEEATVKTAKAAYLSKMAVVDELMAKAKALGLDINVRASGLAVASSKPPPQMQQQPIQEAVDDAEMMPKAIFDQRSSRIESQAVASGVGHGLGKLAAHNLPKEMAALSKNGKVKGVIQESQSGRPILLPARTVDDTGTTVMQLVTKEDDGKLQRRFKEMAGRSVKSEDGISASYRESTVSCPLCRGECVIVQSRQEIACPKCGGVGSISIY